MFGKKETFKYEVEVNALIREVTNNLNQRVLALELQNNQLIIQNQKLEYELNTLRHTIYSDVQRLEKRITDFTDLWHPIMTENMNRIKAELETTIKQAEREDIQKISFDLENKLTKIVENYKAEKCVNNIAKIPEYYGLYIKLSDIANGIINSKQRFDINMYFNICDIYRDGLIIVDDNNKIIVSGIDKDGNKINCNDYGKFWKIILEEEGIYTIWNYLIDKCYNIIIDAHSFHGTVWGVGQGNIMFPRYPNNNQYGDGYMFGKSVEQVMKNRKQFINWFKYGGGIPDC